MSAGSYIHRQAIKELRTLQPDLEYTPHPELSFAGKSFCLTGKFDGYDRTALQRQLASKGGSYTANVSEETDYLVIGSQGTRCCSFSCCKRVVERAVELKDLGAPMLFIKESDFMDALRA
jgi:NAD-dependent DNA ligase